MKIQRFAQSTFVIENDDGKRMLIDPGTSGYAGCRNMTDYGKVDLVVITHSHQDHFDVGGTKELVSAQNPKIFTNPEIHTILQGETVGSRVVHIGDCIEEEGFTLTLTKTDHNPGGNWIVNFGIIVESDEQSIYHPSDTRLIQPQLLPKEKVTQTDVLLVPISNRGLVMGIDDALFFTNMLTPKIVIPIHYESAHDIGRVLPEHFVDRLNILKEYLTALNDVEVKIMDYAEELIL